MRVALVCATLVAGSCTSLRAVNVTEPSTTSAPGARPTAAAPMTAERSAHSGDRLPSSGSQAGEPAVSALGSDVSALPREYPHGDWLPIEAPLLSMELVVRVSVNGRSALATLDTGAQGSTMSVPVARQLGVLADDAPRGMPVRAVDSHGDVILGERLAIDELALGRRRFANADITVIGDVPGLFLIGADVLQGVDLFIAADEGLVGVFDAGAAPKRADDIVVPVQRGDRQLTVAAAARGTTGARFPLLVDTGAWNTSVPVATGVRAGLPADLTYTSTTVGVAGEQESRGRFVLSPLLIGDHGASVGRVLAVASTIDRGDGLGLLGNDVFFRFHSVVSFRDAALRLRPLAPRGNARSRGPAGRSCTTTDGPTACVRVALVPTTTTPLPGDLPGACLQVDVDAAYAGSTVELAITAETPGDGSLFNGGAIRAFVSVANDGAHHCFTLWGQLARLGVRPETPLQLRWVRTEGVRWPCDPLKTRCITFSGPLARLSHD